jgi:hypothetical protein
MHFWAVLPRGEYFWSSNGTQQGVRKQIPCHSNVSRAFIGSGVAIFSSILYKPKYNLSNIGKDLINTLYYLQKTFRSGPPDDVIGKHILNETQVKMHKPTLKKFIHCLFFLIITILSPFLVRPFRLTFFLTGYCSTLTNPLLLYMGKRLDRHSTTLTSLMG